MKYEVVFAKSETHLVDAFGNECRYRLLRGSRLSEGYYVVTWPPDIEEALFDEKAQYRGPFETSTSAHAIVSQLQGRNSNLKPLLLR